MELELQADPGSIEKLGSFKPLVALRAGRARSHAVKRIWHDSPDRALMEAGETLAESNDGWHIERLVPNSLTWLPGQPPTILAAAADRETLNGALPEALAPVAAFDGRRTISTHRFDQSLVTLSVERGILRAVTAEQPVARLILEGEDQAVRAGALLIAGAFPVHVPAASLAARGISLAIGVPPPPRHLGPPRLPDPDMPVADALTHILGHLTDVILHYAPAACLPDEAARAESRRIEAVHQMRVAVRRSLSAASIFRTALPPDTLEPLRAALKTLAQALAHTRDWDVFVSETSPMVAAALPGDERLARLFTAADRRRRDYRRALEAYLSSAAFRVLGIELAWFAGARCWQSSPPAEPLPEDDAGGDPPPASVRQYGPLVVKQRWKKMLGAGKHIEDLDVPALHALRLRTKRARYAAEMFASLDDGKSDQRAIHRLADLQQALGVLNDGAVAAHLLEELGGAGGRHAYAVGLVTGFIAARATRMRPQIERAFSKLRK